MIDIILTRIRILSISELEGHLAVPSPVSHSTDKETGSGDIASCYRTPGLDLSSRPPF